MTHEPLVSIVLPTYNGARYLDQAVQSCLDQTYGNWELIIVDDASTDDTPARIAQYVAWDNRIRSMRHETNRKLPASLNTGFSQAQGDHLTWTSDDNCYRPSALAEMVGCLHSEPGVDIVYADYTEIDEAGDPVRYVPVGGPEGLVFSNCIGPCFLYRRAVQDGLGGYAEDLFLAEDYDFWLRASVSFRWCPLHQDLYLYRRHGASLTDLRHEHIRLVTAQALSRSLPHMHWLSDSARASAYLRLATAAQMHQHATRARRYLECAIRYAPRRWILSGELRDMFSQFYASTAFAGHARGDMAQVRRSIVPAIVLNPTWLKNRGVLSMLLEMSIGSETMNYVRNLTHRMAQRSARD